jgi:hypothetical protein
MASDTVGPSGMRQTTVRDDIGERRGRERDRGARWIREK